MFQPTNILNLHFKIAIILIASVGICILSPQLASAQLAEAVDANAEMASKTGPFNFHTVRLESAPRVSKRAWESRPYQVAVWICHRGDPQLAAVESRLISEVGTHCELLDASGWFVNVGTPPPMWRNVVLTGFDDNEKIAGLDSEPELQHYDKLMLVRLGQEAASIRIEVRELDLQTGQWGPLVDYVAGSTGRLGSLIGKGVANAFMPLAKIERVDEKNKVHVRARGLEACVRVASNGDGAEMEPTTSSPVFVRKEDRLLPIIRKTNRSGDLVSLTPIPFTFLTLDSISGSGLIASIHSSQRAPLSQRKSKRSQKLAIVIRPVDRSSTLHLESMPPRGEQPSPLEGYEVWARKPGDTKDVESEFLGKTDWQGNVTVPPAASGLRLLYIKRGARALRKLPVIPGFKDRLVSQLPSDDVRLFAEGVINGYGNDIINLVVQRELLEADIEEFLEKKNMEEARSNMREYLSLETPADLKVRMSNEEVRLKSMTTDKREFEFVSKMFGNLRNLLNEKVSDSRVTELQEKIQLGISSGAGGEK